MFNKMLIIGCGLIGSSILRGSIEKKIAKQIFVFEKSKKYKKSIKKINNSIKFLKNLDKKISDIDFIIICTPMSEYENIVNKLKKSSLKKCLITEVGSSKNKILRLKRKVDLIYSHPIAGSEVSGPNYGNSQLFKNKWCIIIKDKNTKKLKLIRKFWSKLGSKIIYMNPTDHDKIFAITSHLPHLIAYNLIKTAQDFQKKEKKNIIKYSAGGLRDFSRTAASNEIMWRDIFFSNKKNMINTIDMFTKNLNIFKKYIKNSNDYQLKKILVNSKRARKQIINLKQDVSKPNFGREEF
tara:strand:+ start:92 stop:976 length:885 start_codon:yes stop_codon:yes gene_type:complete